MQHNVSRLLTMLPLMAAPFCSQAQSLTHLGQPILNHITLLFAPVADSVCPRFNGDTTRGFVKASTRGAFAQTAFRVPGDKRLVITDVNWDNAFRGGVPLPEPGEALDVVLEVFNAQGAKVGAVYDSPQVTVSSETKTAIVGGNENLTAGAVVGSGLLLCARGRIWGHTGRKLDFLPSVWLRGYLLPK